MSTGGDAKLFARVSQVILFNAHAADQHITIYVIHLDLLMSILCEIFSASSFLAVSLAFFKMNTSNGPNHTSISISLAPNGPSYEI
jgi:hypothetical protein